MRVSIGLAFGAVIALSTFANAAVVEEFKAEDWDGLAFTNDETGDFTHCSVYASYKNGSTLYISYEVTDKWFFSVANDSWTLDEGGSFDIKFKVDRRGEIEGTGTALGPTQIGLPVEPDHAFVGQLRRGNTLTITFQKEEYSFELSNSNKAMNAAQDCVRRHVRLGTKTPIVTSDADEPKPQESQQAEQQPAEAEAPSADTGADSQAVAAGEQQPAEAPSAETGTDAPAVAAGEQQTFGPWVVTAADDGNGTFINCTAYGVHGDDQLILSYFPDNVWTFGLYRSGWNLDTNQTYYLWYNVDAPADAGDVIKRPVEAAEPTRIFFEVSDVEDIIDRIEHGKTLNLQFRGVTGDAESYSYDLDQAPAAFAATRKCVTDRASATTAAAEEPAADTAANEEPAAESDTGADNSAATHTELPVLGATVIEEFEVPGWKAAALSTEDGTFTHCGIKAEYQNGATLGMARTASGDLLLAIQHNEWSLAAGDWVPLSYTLGGDSPLDAETEGQVLVSDLIIALMGATESMTLAVKAAPQIDIKTEGKELSFDITDIAPGITAIDECAAKHASKRVPTPKGPAVKKVESAPEEIPADDTAEAAPVGPDTLPPDVDVASLGDVTGDPAAIRTEAAGYTTALLFRAGFPNHLILAAGAEIPAAVPPGEAAWELGEVMGSTKIIGAGSLDAIKSSVGGYMLDKCGGGILNTQVITSDATHMHFRTKCKASDTNATHFVVLPRDTGGSYLFALLGAVDDIAAASIAESVYNKAVGG